MYSNELRIKFPLSHCFPLPSASFPHSTVHSCVHTAVHLSSIVESFIYVLFAYAKEKSAWLIQLASTASRSTVLVRSSWRLLHMKPQVELFFTDRIFQGRHLRLIIIIIIASYPSESRSLSISSPFIESQRGSINKFLTFGLGLKKKGAKTLKSLML